MRELAVTARDEGCLCLGLRHPQVDPATGRGIYLMLALTLALGCPAHSFFSPSFCLVYFCLKFIESMN